MSFLETSLFFQFCFLFKIFIFHELSKQLGLAEQNRTLFHKFTSQAMRRFLAQVKFQTLLIYTFGRLKLWTQIILNTINLN